ncbi:MAG TPA: hypothetical protein VIR34_13865 [Gemmatimonadaceae bacterium]|jgi:hypothetical protein
MSKSEFLQIRMTPEGHQRLRRVAEADHLDKSTWARRAIMQALDAWDAEHQRGRSTAGIDFSERRQQRRVAEAKLPTPPGSASRPAQPAKPKTPKRKKLHD